MNITPKTVHLALSRLLSTRQMSQGDTYPLKDLIAAWPETLLRRGDLIQGLEGLRQSGHLSIDQTSYGPMVRLINGEFGLIRTARDREAVATLNRLREARRRPNSHLAGLVPGLRFGRRPNDGAAASAR